MIVQKGGVLGALVDVLITILTKILPTVMMGIWNIGKVLLGIEEKEGVKWNEFNRFGELMPDSNERLTWGYGWKYLYWCFKTVIYLVIFCFGGPIVILIGIIYLYSTLFGKLTKKTKENTEA